MQIWPMHKRSFQYHNTDIDKFNGIAISSGYVEYTWNVRGRWSVRGFAIWARRLSLAERDPAIVTARALANDRNRVCLRIIWNACNKAAIAHASTYYDVVIVWWRVKSVAHSINMYFVHINANLSTHTRAPERRRRWRRRLGNNVFEWNIRSKRTLSSCWRLSRECVRWRYSTFAPHIHTIDRCGQCYEIK